MFHEALSKARWKKQQTLKYIFYCQTQRNYQTPLPAFVLVIQRVSFLIYLQFQIEFKVSILKKMLIKLYCVNDVFMLVVAFLEWTYFSITFGENKGENQQRQLKTKTIVFYFDHYKKVQCLNKK